MQNGHVVVAHVAGMPIEEALVPVLSGLGACVVLARAWVGSRLRDRRGPRVERDR